MQLFPLTHPVGQSQVPIFVDLDKLLYIEASIAVNRKGCNLYFQGGNGAVYVEESADYVVNEIERRAGL